MPVTAGTRDEEISQRAQYAKGGFGRWYWDFRDRAALAWVNGTHILDAGCGEGITLEKLVKRFPHATVQGIDTDPANIRICEAHSLPIRKGSLYDLPYSENSQDCCVFMEVIEHLDAPERALEEITRVLRPGGRLVIVYPIDWAMFMVRLACLRFREARFDPGHVRQWTLGDLKKALRAAGLRLVHARGLPLPPPLTLHRLAVAERI